MANDLYGDGVGEVLSALDSATLPADVEQLVLTALLAPDELSSDAALNERVKRPMIEPDATDPSTALAPVYLNSISIRGFRGVGNEAVSLDLQPHPGLTLVTGRNGSGKSSIAEALEMLMSGGSARWNGRNVVWRDSWQHLDAEETVIAAKFVCEGTPGNISVTQRTSKYTLPANAPSAQVEWPGSSYADLGACGWAEALGQFRPFLSYNELCVSGFRRLRSRSHEWSDRCAIVGNGSGIACDRHAAVERPSCRGVDAKRVGADGR
jgi:AAA domain